MGSCKLDLPWGSPPEEENTAGVVVMAGAFDSGPLAAAVAAASVGVAAVAALLEMRSELDVVVIAAGSTLVHLCLL